MKNEHKKKALGEYLEAKKEWVYWAKKVEELEKLDIYRSPAITGMPGSGSTGNQIEAAVLELETNREYKAAAQKRMEEAHAKVMDIIQTAPEADQRVLLMRRYIDGQSWDEIAEAAGKSRT